MPVRVEQYGSGHTVGAIYEVDVVGEGIRMHRHPPEMAHNVIVLRGSVLVYGPEGSGCKHLSAGDVWDFDWSQWHEIMALEPNTKIFNVSLVPVAPEARIGNDATENYVVGELTHRLRLDGELEMLPEYNGAFI